MEKKLEFIRANTQIEKITKSKAINILESLFKEVAVQGLNTILVLIIRLVKIDDILFNQDSYR